MIIVVMPPCTGTRLNTNYEQIASWGGCQWRTGDHRILETNLAAHSCSQRPNHSAMTHPLTQIGTISAVSHMGYNSESIVGRNDSPLSCLHLALAYMYFVWRRHANMPSCTDDNENGVAIQSTKCWHFYLITLCDYCSHMLSRENIITFVAN